MTHHIRNISVISLIFLIILTVSACSRKSDAPPVSLLRIECKSPQSVSSDSLASLYQPAFSLLAEIYGVESADSAIARYYASSAQKVFSPDIISRFKCADSIASELGLLRRRLPTIVSDVTIPETVYTFASPYRQSVILSDTTLLIALNHYLGADYPGYQSFEPYIRATKIPARLPLDVAEAVIASTRPYSTGSSPTTLSRMLYEGALLHTVSCTLPDTDVATLLGYTDDELAWATTNEQRAWHTLVGSDLLFSTDPAIASRLTQPSPATTIINPAAPGRLGRYLGLRIIQSYLRHNPDTPADTLLSPSFYNSPETLRKARYAP